MFLWIVSPETNLLLPSFRILIISVAASIHYLEHLFYLSGVALCTMKSSIDNPLHVRWSLRLFYSHILGIFSTPISIVITWTSCPRDCNSSPKWLTGIKCPSKGITVMATFKCFDFSKRSSKVSWSYFFLLTFFYFSFGPDDSMSSFYIIGTLISISSNESSFNFYYFVTKILVSSDFF